MARFAGGAQNAEARGPVPPEVNGAPAAVRGIHPAPARAPQSSRVSPCAASTAHAFRGCMDPALPATSRLGKMSHTGLHCTIAAVSPAPLSCRACMSAGVHGWERPITGL